MVGILIEVTLSKGLNIPFYNSCKALSCRDSSSTMSSIFLRKIVNTKHNSILVSYLSKYHFSTLFVDFLGKVLNIMF